MSGAPLTSQQYAEGRGVRCPCCGSENVTGGRFECDAGSAWQPVDCEECGASWQDVYVLNGYENLSPGSTGPA